MIEEVRPTELATAMEHGEDWQILDVREPWEYAIVSLDVAIPMPMAEVSSRHMELDRNRPLAVLCHSGVRSRRVAGFLAPLGFARVVNIAGGIDAWSQEVDHALPRY